MSIATAWQGMTYAERLAYETDGTIPTWVAPEAEGPDADRE